MTVLLHIRYSDILYADDTLLITTGSHLTHRFLSLIEKESAYYNLKFNHSKCQVLCMNGIKQISFQNGERLENVNHAKYLGCLLSKKMHVFLRRLAGGSLRPWMP